MAYRDFIVKLIQEKSTRCFCCHNGFTRLDYKAIHSMTGLHFEAIKIKEPEPHYMLVVTDPPSVYANMKGVMYEDLSEFGLDYFGLDGDAVCLCKVCHENIHALALELCRERIPGFKGNTPLPRVLVDATVNYYRYRPRLT